MQRQNKPLPQFNLFKLDFLNRSEYGACTVYQEQIEFIYVFLLFAILEFSVQ